MTQHCTYDEKLLDFVYEEMDEKEAEAFSAHVEGCATCQRNMAGFRRVRSAFRDLPRPAPEEDVLQRMTAQILHQAAPLHPKTAVQTLQSTSNLPSAEIGKVLPFRRKGVLGVILHPASGIVAAAALALVFVVAKDWRGEMLPPLAPAPPLPALTAAPGGAPTTPAVAIAQQVAAPDPAPPVTLQAKVDEEAKSKSPRPIEAPRAEKASSRAAGKLEKDDLDAVLDSAQVLGGSTAGTKKEVSADRARPAKPASAGWDQKSALGPAGGSLGLGGLESRRSRDEGAAAAPPVPMQQLAKDGRKYAEPPADKPAERRPAEEPAAPPAKAQAPAQAPPATGNYPPPQGQAPEIAEAGDALKQRLSNSQRSDFNAVMSRGKGRGQAAGAAAGPQANNESDEGGAAALEKLREHVRKGQCREATDAKTELEQRFHGFEIPAADRLAYQRLCQAAPLDRESPSPSPSPNFDQQQQAAPAQSYRRASPKMERKATAPARAKSNKAADKAADKPADNKSTPAY